MTTVRTTRAQRAAGGLAAVGGTLALLSGLVALWVAIDRAAVNPLSLWTVVAGLGAGVLAIGRPSATGRWLSLLLVVAAAAPALPGGLGYLFLPAALALLAASITALLAREPSSSGDTT